MEREAVTAAGPSAAAGVDDSLLECLILVARAQGTNLTRDAALAGLPLAGGGLTPALLSRAARRAGLSSRIVQHPLERLNDALLPAILLLEGNEACILVGWQEGRAVARVVFPELGDAAVDMPAAELARRYLGRAIYLRPRFRFDARTPQVRPSRHGHWFWSVVAENRSLYRDVLLAAFAINLFAVAMPLFVMNVYDRVVPNHAIETLWVLAAGVFVVLVAEFVLRTMRGYFIDLAGNRADVKLSAVIMERVLGMRMETRPSSVGSFAANLRAFESVRDFISSATVIAFIDLPFALLFLAVVGWIAWPLLLPFVVGIVALLLYAVAVQGKMRELSETIYRAGAQRNATLVEGLVGIEAIKTLGAEGVVQRRWEQTAALLAGVGSKLRLLSASATNASLWVQHSVSVAVIVMGIYLIGDGGLSMGGLIACYLLSSRAMAPISQVASLLVHYHNASTSLSALEGLMAQEVERPEEAAFISRKTLRGGIEFRDVGFTYPGQSASVLRNVSLRIQPGEHVAILGRVGSGKTTLEKLILGLYRPTSGAVLVDGIDLRQLDPAELRRNIGYVAQDPMLFYGSLRDNLVLGAAPVEDEDVLKAARIAGILDLVNAHPQGFDLQVGERGSLLSGGQRQAVALARALINDPPVLLFDEPTSSMDRSTEENVKHRLRSFAKGKTMIVITHRTSLLELVDRIIVIDAGRIVADGPKAHVVEALRQGRVGRGT
ncbi:type I secretion system permease/ATPase [Thauera aromatica]|uniref:type I secretion system permease/ATPase n=1 Tax=Thauera aromatica TaxID=59405 RepID=UPI001FFD28BB|nr:type I secretion system permease/ATPase [Thauera aromatica]MCK2088034.1 type I secretion system permease/ATPase [Thauera aromatica]